MKKPIILGVAPVAHDLPQYSVCGLSPRAVAEEVIACAALGASVVHLHVRDAQGWQTEDLTAYGETLAHIRSRSDIILQGSTGGLSTLTLEKRSVSVTHPLTETASLNMGSVNFGEDVYINTLPDIRFWAKRMLDNRVSAELEVFDLSMVDTAVRLRGEGLLEHTVFNLALGFPSALAATQRYMGIMRDEFLRIEGAVWGFMHHGMPDMRLLKTAMEMGADMIRVGFEDSAYVREGETAPDNAALVREAVGMIRRMGYEVASPAYAREKLGVMK